MLAQNAGAADQKITNYKDAIAEQARLEDLNAQQKQWDRQNADSDRDYARVVAGDKAAQDRTDKLEGKGLTLPAGTTGTNKGKGGPKTPEQKRDDMLSAAAYYRSQGAFDKADEYEGAANDLERVSNNADKNLLAAAKEKSLDQYRTAQLAGITSRFNSKQQQQYSEFTRTYTQKSSQFLANYAQRGQIASLTSQDRVYLGQLAAVNRMQGMDENNAMKAAIAQYTQGNENFRAQERSLDPAVAAGAAPTPWSAPAAPTVNYKSKLGADVMNLRTASSGQRGAGRSYNFGPNGAPAAPTGSVSTVPTGNLPAIPANPGAAQSKLGSIYGRPAGSINATPAPARGSQPATDPQVSAAVPAAIEALKHGDGIGVTVATLPALLQKVYKLSPAQVQAVMAQVKAQTGNASAASGAVQQLPVGGMKFTGTRSAGGAANPFPQPTP